MVSDHEFRMLLDYFRRPWAGYRKVRKGVKKRVTRHMRRLGCSDFSSYVRVLESQPEELQVCLACLQVTISRFYRDRMLWLCLEGRILPDLLQRFPEGIAAWSAGCAGGEEPYSLAMLWSALGRPATFRLVASDADPVSLQRAGKGRYQPGSLKEVPEKIKKSHFTRRCSGDQFQIDPGLTQSIEWVEHNLTGPPLPGPFHLLFLRNNLLPIIRGKRL